MRLEAPELEVGTGVDELGVTLTPSIDLPLSFDLDVQGYVGTREGVTGSLQVKYEFCLALCAARTGNRRSSPRFVSWRQRRQNFRIHYT